MTNRRLYDVLAEAFVAEGVDTHFTLLGDANMHWATILAENHRVQTIHTRHEHCACAMATAYAEATGRVGVASVTHGPGFTQTMTALATAARGNIPLVVFAGEVPTTAVWTLQYIDQAPLALASGAEYIPIRSVKHALDRVREAFTIARSERKPVVLGVPTDLQRAPFADAPNYVSSASIMPRAERAAPDPASVDAIVDMIVQAQRPIVIAGKGAVQAGAKAALQEFAAQSGALLSTTLPARCLFDGDPASIGIAGGWSSDVAHGLFAESDLVIAVGASLTGHTTDAGRLYPKAKVVQIDLGPQGVRHSRVVADCHMQADAKAGVEAINRRLTERGIARNGYRTPEILLRIAQAADTIPYSDEAGVFDPRLVVQALDRAIPKDWFVVGGSGHCAYFVATSMRDRPPELFISIRDFGAIGSNIAHAIGIAVARKDPKILLVDGDGSLMMHIQELETIRRHGIKMLIVALNDGAYSSEVHKLRADGFNANEVQFGRPDFAGMARGFGLRGRTVTGLDELPAMFEEHRQGGQAEIWDVPISGDVISIPFRREHARKH
jgi:thiamine pyrophosphate-dependent acetolactate synthase large subunit-like protein